MKYKEWLLTENSAFMLAPDFFLGNPLDTEKAPINATIRAAVYNYIKDVYSNRTLGVTDPERWAELFRAKLTEVNGTFWKQIQMDTLVRVNDLVTADFKEFTQQYNRGSSAQQAQHSGVNQQKSKTTASGDQTTNPVTITTTPTRAAKTVQLSSQLAESTYSGNDVPGSGILSPDGMPSIDTTHGDTAAGSWSISEATEQVQSEVITAYGDTSTGSIAGSNASADYVKAVNDNIGGMMREGFHDFNGYNLRASIEAVQALLPFDYLRLRLNPLFASQIDLDVEEV